MIKKELSNRSGAYIMQNSNNHNITTQRKEKVVYFVTTNANSDWFVLHTVNEMKKWMKEATVQQTSLNGILYLLKNTVVDMPAIVLTDYLPVTPELIKDLKNTYPELINLPPFKLGTPQPILVKRLISHFCENIGIQSPQMALLTLNCMYTKYIASFRKKVTSNTNEAIALLDDASMPSRFEFECDAYIDKPDLMIQKIVADFSATVGIDILRNYNISIKEVGPSKLKDECQEESIRYFRIDDENTSMYMYRFIDDAIRNYQKQLPAPNSSEASGENRLANGPTVLEIK